MTTPLGPKVPGASTYEELLELGSSCHAPKNTLTRHCLEEQLNTWSRTLEHTSVAVLPDLPRDQDDEGVQTLAMIFRHMFYSCAPPSRKTGRRGGRSGNGQIQVLKY